MARPRSDAKKRFLAMVTYAANGCHEWKGTLHWGGYGKFHYEAGHIPAHRAAYLLFVGKIPEDALILHHCDNRKCVNPKHLYAGTHSDNAKDKIQRFGGMWGRMKYTQEQIEEAKRLYAKGMTQTAIAKQLGMDQTSVSRFVRNRYMKRK